MSRNYLILGLSLANQYIRQRAKGMKRTGESIVPTRRAWAGQYQLEDKPIHLFRRFVAGLRLRLFNSGEVNIVRNAWIRARWMRKVN